MLFTFDGRSMLLQHLLTPDHEDVEPLGAMWMALLNGPLQPTDDGESIAELAATSYTRMGIGAISQFWTLTGHGLMANATPLYWPPSTTDWGRVTGWALCTDAHAGLAIAGGDFLDSLIIDAGSVVGLAPGMLVLEVA